MHHEDIEVYAGHEREHRVWFITVTGVASICRSATLNAWLECEWTYQLAVSVTPYDNAMTESINGLYKTEAIRRRGPLRHTDDAEYATLGWVYWFNNRCLLEPIGNVLPAVFERVYYHQLEDSALAA